MVIRPDQGAVVNLAPTRWTALSDQTLISLTKNYPHQLLIDRQLEESGITYTRGQIVNLLETQIALVEANEGIAVIPSFGLLACRTRKVTMSELIDPVVNLEFYQISSRARRLSEEAKQFAEFLKMYIASWVGSGGVL
jgi:DNA-binding transcriptional LysR family regulator